MVHVILNFVVEIIKILIFVVTRFDKCQKWSTWLIVILSSIENLICVLLLFSNIIDLGYQWTSIHVMFVGPMIGV